MAMTRPAPAISTRTNTNGANLPLECPTSNMPMLDQETNTTSVPTSPESQISPPPYTRQYSATQISKKPKRIKLTILNLSGIKVQAVANHSSTQTSHSDRQPHKFAITSTVSFTGSCDPEDMRVVSSGFCSASERLVVESIPVVVPYGMNDSLIAIWDDVPTIASPRNSRGSLFAGNTSVFGKEKGAISIESKSVLPHLFVSIPGIVEEKKEEEHDADVTSGVSPAETSTNQHHHGIDAKALRYNVNGEEDDVEIKLYPELQQQSSSAFSTSLPNSHSPDLDETDTSSSLMSRDFEFITSLVKENTPSPRQPQPQPPSTAMLRLSTIPPLQSLTNVRQITLPEESSLKLPASKDYDNHNRMLRLSTIPPLQSMSSVHPTTVPEESTVNLPVRNRMLDETLPPIHAIYEKEDTSVPHQTIVNTPSQAALETPIPEILEFNLALNIQQLPSNHPSDEHDYEELNNVRSSCTPECGAVAHLVLFPDILNTESLADGGKIIELPVRRKTIQLNRLGGGSSVSGLTSRCASTVSSRKESKRFQCDPDAWVDLEHNATIRVKLEECTDEDEAALDGGNPLFNNFSSFITDVSLADHIDEKESDDCKLKTVLSRENLIAKALMGTTDKNPLPSEETEGASHEPQADDTPATSNNEDEEESPNKNQNHNAKNSLLKKDSSRPKGGNGMLCETFHIENLVRAFSGIVANCSEEADIYGNIGTQSMDSTIQTFE